MQIRIESGGRLRLRNAPGTPSCRRRCGCSRRRSPLRQAQHDQVISLARLAKRARGGGAGFLVVRLAVDDRGDPVLGVAAHPPPDFHHVAAGRVHHVAAALLDLVHEFRRCAEGRDDDHVVLRQVVVAFAHVLPRQRDDAHLAQVAVHVRVVDDFPDEENPVLRENPARGVGQVDGPLHAVAEAELLRQQHVVFPTEIFPPRSRSFSTIVEWKWIATSAATRSITSGRRTFTRGFFTLLALRSSAGDIVAKPGGTNSFLMSPCARRICCDV